MRHSSMTNEVDQSMTKRAYHPESSLYVQHMTSGEKLSAQGVAFSMQKFHNHLTNI